MDDELRVIGSLVAAGLSGSVAIGALTVGHMELLSAGAALGIPVGAVLGFRNAPRVSHQSPGQAFESTLVLAAKAVLLGDLVFSTAWLLFAALSSLGGTGVSLDPVMVIAGALAVPIAGLLVLGLPSFALAFGVIWPWTFLIRWVGRHHVDRRISTHRAGSA